MAEAGIRVDVEGRTLSLSNLDKVLYPRTGTTKGEVLDYYARISPVMLPHLAARPVTRVRWPHGVERGSFFEKNAPAGTPSWVHTARVPTTGSRGDSRHGDHLEFPIVDDLATLTWLANLAALELHVHQWTVGRNGQPRNPDRLVIDLDPGEGAGLHECAAVALLVRDALAERGPRVVPGHQRQQGPPPVRRPARRPQPRGHDRAGQGGRRGAPEGAHPQQVTATMTKARRSGKVFLDWSQNAGSKTTLSPYSLRGRERPWVATPLSWDEVEEGAEDPVALEQMGFDQVLQRVADRGDLLARLVG